MNEKTRPQAKAKTSAGVAEKALDRTHEFTLILDADELTDEMANRLYEAGCSDSTIVRQSGATMMMFARAAKSYEDAVVAAIEDVYEAGYEIARVAADDMLTQADIARIIGRRRQTVSLYVKGERGPGGFPTPERGAPGEHALWRWSKVAAWLQQSKLASERMAHEAETTDAINFVLGHLGRLRSKPDVYNNLVARISAARLNRGIKPEAKRRLTSA